MPDDLDAARVRIELEKLGTTMEAPLSVVDETGSTNDDARAAASRGAPHGAVFIADMQTKGRGRGAHAWHSPPGANIYLSLITRPAVAASTIAQAALAAGVGVARAVEALAGEGAAIKWPNDVLVGGKKIAGVLVEGQLRGDRAVSLVVGVGLNVLATSFPAELEARATSLVRLGVASDRAVAAARLIFELNRTLSAFEAGGLAVLIEELTRRDALLGARVRASEIEGVAAGIDPAGRLLVRTEDGAEHAIASGSVERMYTEP